MYVRLQHQTMWIGTVAGPAGHHGADRDKTRFLHYSAQAKASEDGIDTRNTRTGRERAIRKRAVIAVEVCLTDFNQ